MDQKVTISAPVTYHDYYLRALTKAISALCNNNEQVQRELKVKKKSTVSSDIYLPDGCDKLNLGKGTLIEFL